MSQQSTSPSVALVPQEERAVPTLASSSAAFLEAYTPRSYEQALAMAGTLAKAAKITPEAAFLKMAAGAEFGVPATTALRQIDIIPGSDGSHQIGFRAQFMVGLCLRSPFCEYIRQESGDDKSATWVAKRRGYPEDRETYTIEDAARAKLIRDGGNWTKDPRSMLTARASSRLARRVFPDVIGNVYTPEELAEAMEGARPAVAAAEPVQALPQAARSSAPVVDGEVVEGDEARLVRLLGAASTAEELKPLVAEALRIWPRERPEAVKAAHVAAKARLASPTPAQAAPPHDATTGEVREPGEDG